MYVKDTNIMILCGLQAEILADVGFCIMAALKIQDGCHQVSWRSGTYQKLKAKDLGSMWGKFGAFVRNVHIQLKSCAKLPDYVFHCVVVIWHLCILQVTITTPGTQKTQSPRYIIKYTTQPGHTAKKSRPLCHKHPKKKKSICFYWQWWGQIIHTCA